MLPHAADDLAAIGFAGAEMLTTLTATAATVCGVGDRKGRLAAGYDADVLAVGGDPLEDLGALTRPHLVLNRGSTVSAEPHGYPPATVG